MKNSDDIPMAERIRYPLGACLIVFCFLSFIYNRFLPAQDAWFANYGEMMKQGRLPYRDFYCFIQPIPLLISRILVSWDEKLIYFRYYGCVERLVLTGALYWMLRQPFSRFSAFVGTVTSIIVMTSCSDDALYSYYVTCLLFAVIAIGALARGLMAGSQHGSLLFVSGFFLGLAFYTKQSYGGLLGISFFLILVFVSISWRILFQSLCKVGAGFSLFGLPFSIWLLGSGISGDYLREVYFNAVSQKGGASMIMTGFLGRLNQTPFVIAVGLAVVFMLLLFLLGILGLKKSGPDRRENGRGLFFATVLLFLIALVAPIRFSTLLVPWLIESRIYISLLFLIPLVFYATAALLVYLLSHRARLLQGQPSCNLGLLVLVAGAMSGLYATGMSYEITPHAMAPALGVCLAFLIDFLQPGRRHLATYGAIFLSVGLVLVGATKKYLSSYWWYGWEDTCLHPPGHSRLPQLAGFDLDPDECDIYQRIVDLANQSLGPGDHLFSFPNCPMFNYLTHHPQPTFAPVHYLDVCPDSVDEADAARLLHDPPRLIVWLRAGQADMALQESSFRGGRRSGFNEMEDTLRTLTQSGAYERLFRRQYNDESFPIEVWRRIGGSSPSPAGDNKPEYKKHA